MFLLHYYPYGYSSDRAVYVKKMSLEIALRVFEELDVFHNFYSTLRPSASILNVETPRKAPALPIERRKASQSKAVLDLRNQDVCAHVLAVFHVFFPFQRLSRVRYVIPTINTSSLVGN